MKQKVVVIGAGLAGSLLCNELAKQCDVTLLEKGSKNRIQFPKVYFFNKKFAEVNTFCFGGGGTTNLWHNGLMPISIKDITNEAFRDLLTDAQFFVDEAASALFFKNGSFSDEYAQLLEEVNSFPGRFQIFYHGIDCLIYPKKYKKLTVRPEVNDIYDVEDINFIFEGRKLKTVHYFTGRKKYSVDADTVIVCAGALGTPAILRKIMRALGAPDGKVGTGFIDHPMGFVGKVKFKKDISKIIKRLCTYDKGSYVSRNAVRIKSQCGRYTACAFFRPALTMSNNLAIYKYKSSLGASNGLVRLKSVFSFKLFHPDIMAEIVEHLFGFRIPSRTYNILFIAEQKRGRNWVGGLVDDLKVDWSISVEEIAIYQDMLNSLKNMLYNLAEEINIQTNISSDWLWSAAHHSGTIPLGDKSDSVVDKDLKLHVCDNVYVCDGSIIQEHSYANTGLTIGSLAMRLAVRIGRE